MTMQLRTAFIWTSAVVWNQNNSSKLGLNHVNLNKNLDALLNDKVLSYSEITNEMHHLKKVANLHKWTWLTKIDFEELL
jgi:hypothetical protein